jgi:diguanylate cyclase (GGDEF)-like protein/PAS domain S-box-containing protein
MPDYNRAAGTVWWAGALLGGLALLGSLAWVLAQGLPVLLQVALGSALAVAAGLFPVRVPGTRNAYTAGEVFIFGLLLLLGPAAAAVAAACEAFAGTLRTSKRWTSRIFSPASAALAMVLAGSLLHSLRGLATGAAALPALTLVFSALYFFINAALVSGVLQLKRGERFWQGAGLLSVFRWVGLAYAGSASLAALLFFTWQQHGVAALWVMLPLLLLLLLVLHLYFKQQELAQQLNTAHSKAAERHLHELQASERRFHSAFTHASIGMALLAFDGRVLQANRALAQVLGRSEDTLLKSRLQELVLAEEQEQVQRQLGLAPQREFEAFTAELRFAHANGSTVWLALHCSFFNDADGQGAATERCLILQAQDVTARRAAEAGLAHLAFHDPLTGLPNRRRFMECLHSAVKRSQSDQRHAWAVMFLDFDRFKLVNDSLGHTAGDDLLQQLARRLQEKLRPGDTVARLGGDEFVILVERVEHEHDAVQLADRLMEAMQPPFMLGRHEITVSASVGITFSAFGYTRAEDVLRDADTAMYKAKSEGKARFAVFDTSLHTAVSQRLRLEGELRQAIAQGQLAVQYQPLFKLAATGHKLTGFEALVRWHHPSGDTLAPQRFLPIAEETGLMLQVSDFVLHCACQQLRQWQLSWPELAALSMSVNLSTHDIADPALVARVSRALVESGLRPEHLTLEITEDILMAHLSNAVQALSALRRLGVRLAVDDFGTGYSSLAHLSRLPVDSLKIDRSFVHQMEEGNDDAAVVSAILQLGSTLRKAVVAEGIETAEQAAHLQALGCELGQGFYLARPLSEAAAGQWLAARRAALH